MEDQQPGPVIQGFRKLYGMEKQLPGDAPALTALGTVLMKGKQPEEAARRFAEALRLRPGYAPYEVNLAAALLETGKFSEAIAHLEHAVQLDPLLERGVELLSYAYRQRNQSSKAEEVMARYRAAMGISAEQQHGPAASTK